MEVVDSQVALLTNYEVLSFLKSLDPRSKRRTDSNPPHPRYNQDENTVEYELVQYLESTPVAQQTAEQVTEFMAQVNNDAGWELTQAEKLQILNLRPVNVVEVNPIVEECDLRFPETKVEQLLEILDTFVPYTPPPDPNAEGVVDEEPQEQVGNEAE